ncbi:hypothetical protein [uncultured Nitrospira sp.]
MVLAHFYNGESGTVLASELIAAVGSPELLKYVLLMGLRNTDADIANGYF